MSQFLVGPILYPDKTGLVALLFVILLHVRDLTLCSLRHIVIN